MYRNICLRSLPLKQLELEISQTLPYSLRKYTHKTDSLLRSVTSIKKIVFQSLLLETAKICHDYNAQNFVSRIRKVLVYDLPSLFLCFLSPSPTTAYSKKIGAVKQQKNLVSFCTSGSLSWGLHELGPHQLTNTKIQRVTNDASHKDPQQHLLAADIENSFALSQQ